jgi:UDP-N-acetylglucosamine---dolichyl-phosphate N-acetylglucosaminyltransferase
MQKNNIKSNKFKNIWIIIPAHNEETNIASVIDQCKDYSKNIVVVDDGSKDKTSIIAKSKGVIVLKHIINLGKGATLKTGCDYVYKIIRNTKNGLQNLKDSAIVLIDADGQHDPKSIPQFLEKLKHKDIIFGIRKYNRNMPKILKIGNNLINYIIKIIFHMKVKDSQCGYRVFKANIYKKIRWVAHDYSMESEMIANVSKYKLHYGQIQIPTTYQDNYKGTTIIDGVKIVYYILKWRIAKW